LFKKEKEKSIFLVLVFSVFWFFLVNYDPDVYRFFLEFIGIEGGQLNLVALRTEQGWANHWNRQTVSVWRISLSL
jgi:hypothetical protein